MAAMLSKPANRFEEKKSILELVTICTQYGVLFTQPMGVIKQSETISVRIPASVESFHWPCDLLPSLNYSPTPSIGFKITISL